MTFLAATGLLLLLFFAGSNANAVADGSAAFVTRVGSQLYLNGTVFRAVGANCYWLGLDENVPPGVVDYPTAFRIHDALAAAKEMGATVVRAHTLGISTGNPAKSFEGAYGLFNYGLPVAVMDLALAIGAELGLKFVVPLTDNYEYYHGGKYDFTQWLNISDQNDFYRDEAAIGAFEQYIKSLLLRVNTVTGVAVVDDPTILAWESGNELLPPAAWTARIARFVKSLDANHLFLDGRYGVDPAALSIPEVDMYSDHFYPMDVDRLVADVKLTAAADKVFFAGEFGWTDGNLSAFTAALTEHRVANCYWSLFPHSDDYGYVQHNDGFTMHWPGVDSEQMRSAAQQLRNTAYAIRAQPPPSYAVPPPPQITSLTSNGTDVTIAWRGAMGAVSYSIYATADLATTSPYSPVCRQCANDNDTPFVLPLPAGMNGYWAVSAVNLDGVESALSIGMPLSTPASK